MVRLLDAERRRVLIHGPNEARGQRVDWLVILGGAPDDLVVDIGDVSHIRDAVAARAQPAAHHVERDQEAGVPKMQVVVDGHAAHVHADLAWHERDERLFRPAQRIEDLQGVDCEPEVVSLE